MAMEVEPLDHGRCQVHADGKHCWHQTGQPAFRQYMMRTPVMCCHCKAKAIHNTPEGGWIEYEPDIR